MPFSPGPAYMPLLDRLQWLDADVSYVAKPLHPLLDLCLHPDGTHTVGFTVHGLRGMLNKAGYDIIPIPKQSTS